MTTIQKEKFKQAGKIAGISLPVLGFAWMVYSSIQTQFTEKQKQLSNFQTKIITNEVNISNIKSDILEIKQTVKSFDKKLDRILDR